MDIPQDIIDSVIVAVGDDTQLLKQCALVSSSFLLPSRKQLFSRITLSIDDQTCQRFHQILVQNPFIKAFVKSIFIEYKWDDNTAAQYSSLLAVLQLPFCNLECFSIDGMYHPSLDWTWNSFSSELKDAILNIIHSSTLKTLSLTGITEVPITFFFHIVHLTTLELDFIMPIDFVGDSSSKGVAPKTSHIAIDRCVWRFKMFEVRDFFFRLFFTNLRQRSHTITEPIFLPFLSRLRFLEIHIELYNCRFEGWTFLIDSLCLSLTSPATLEHLELNIWFQNPTLLVTVNGFTLYEFLREAWSHLDSITTHSTGSRLKRVDININFSFRFRFESYDVDVEYEKFFDEYAVLRAVRDGLPLLHRKGILFVKAALADSVLPT